jgi:hypothetical protein
MAQAGKWSESRPACYTGSVKEKTDPSFGNPEMAVVKRLRELAADYPVECVSCLRLMVEGDDERWLLLGVATDALQLIAVAERSANSRGAEAARALRQNLIGRGHYEFRSSST